MTGRADSRRLRDLQTQLYELVTSACAKADKCDSSDALLADSLIGGGGSLGAVERLGIYREMYFHRLLAVLNEDFPGTAAVLGAEAFRDTVAAYLHEYPPTQPSVFFAGRYLADFLERHASRERWPFIHNLARLERALIEAFHAPDATVLKADTMRAVAPSQWPEFALRTHPATILLEFQWPVSALLRALSAGEPWREPPPLNETVLIWRDRAGVVNYRALGAAEGAALAVAAHGATFAAICEAAVPFLQDLASAADTLREMLARWLAEGVLVHDPG